MARLPDENREYSSASGLITYSGWAGVLSSPATLSFTAEVDIDFENGASICSASYTLDGSSWTNLFSLNMSAAPQTYSATLPAGQNLALVQVSFACRSSVIRGNDDASSDGQIILSNLQIA